jgi:hypothetical protein
MCTMAAGFFSTAYTRSLRRVARAAASEARTSGPLPARHTRQHQVSMPLQRCLPAHSMGMQAVDESCAGTGQQQCVQAGRCLQFTYTKASWHPTTSRTSLRLLLQHLHPLNCLVLAAPQLLMLLRLLLCISCHPTAQACRY